MPVLVALHAVSWWQVVISVVLTLAATVAVSRLAATIYIRAILRTGQRVRLSDVSPFRFSVRQRIRRG
jgi:hypothetical protein